MKFVLAITTCIAAMVGLDVSKTFKYVGYNQKNIIGAWGYGTPDKRAIMINTDKIFSVALYDIPGKKFIGSYGGTFTINNNQLVRNIEWNSMDSGMVGKETSANFELKDETLVLKNSNEIWSRLDDGKPGELMGAWIITGNFRNDTLSKRSNAFYPRRTMKILSGKYFHWVAYNIVTRSFQNAGGGTYSTVNGKYTEQIEFFTKTAESVGKTLVFDYSFVNGDWRHQGQKSTGGEMDECWSRREKLEKK